LGLSFEDSGLSDSAKDALFINILENEDPSAQKLGGTLLSWYGSSGDQVTQSLTRHYRKQVLDGNVLQLEPIFHDNADNSLLLTCQLKAMSELDLASDPPKPFLRDFLSELMNLRINYAHRLNKPRPKGELNPASNPATVPFLVRLVEQQSLEQRPPFTLTMTISLLREFGPEARGALTALVKLKRKFDRQSAPELKRIAQALAECIASISKE